MNRNKVSTHLFFALFGLSVACSTILVCGFYAMVKRNKEAEYRERYEQLGASLSVAFQQSERIARMMNDNAARVLQEIVAQRGLPSDSELSRLAESLHVQSLDITDRAGYFVRSPVGNCSRV